MVKKQEQENKLPRFMVVLKDWETGVEMQVGSDKLNDFLKPFPKDVPFKEKYELERVFSFFKKEVSKVAKEAKLQKE